LRLQLKAPHFVLLLQQLGEATPSHVAQSASHEDSHGNTPYID
jgi:hypothetical protein